MDFGTMLQQAGLRPREIVPDGKIRRCGTEDQPRKRNGWYVLHGDGRGFWGDWAGNVPPGSWSDGIKPFSAEEQARRRAAVEAERARERMAKRRACEVAQALLREATLAPHPYLERKGFPEARGLVVERKGRRLLMVPMYLERSLVGCQLIDEMGEKRFLRGQLTAGAVFTIGQGEPVWCEGYATGLSVQAALKYARMRRSVAVCFSAGNLERIARVGFVVADNDASGRGEQAARATGLPFFMPNVPGEDFNDHMRRVGGLRASQALKLAAMTRFGGVR